MNEEKITWHKDLANRVYQDLGIDLFDEDGYVDIKSIEKLVKIIKEFT